MGGLCNFFQSRRIFSGKFEQFEGKKYEKGFDVGGDFLCVGSFGFFAS